MRVKELVVLEMAIEDGVALGVNRAFKHVDDPTTQEIIEHTYEAIVQQLHEWFEFDDPAY